MPKLTFIQANGDVQTIEGSVGSSVMTAAKRNRVPGIIADCDGECACSTCHVYVEPEWADKLGEVSEAEQMMFGFLDEVSDNSRLCCQIKVTDALDGLVVKVPESQAS